MTGSEATHEASLARARDFPFAVEADPSAYVAPGAVVVGRVRLGARSSVWFGAVLRGDMDEITIGEESNVQDNGVFHVDRGSPARLGRRVVVGHRAIVHGADVEDGALVGMGSVLLTGARIGAGSLVAAGAVVGEGKAIPGGSLVVGVPGRVIGEVSEAMREGISRGADHYVALSRTYLARGVVAVRDEERGGAWLGATAGPPDELEIARLLEILATTPSVVLSLTAGLEPAALARGGGGSAAAAIARWRRDDASAYRARLERLLEDELPALPALPALPEGEPPDSGPLDRALDAVLAERGPALDALRALPLAGWARAGLAPESGPITLLEHVRRWARADLALRRHLATRRPRPAVARR